jgi:hypothetical protein
MWTHVITETTFWKHSQAHVLDRLEKQSLNESVRESILHEKLFKTLNVSREIRVPNVFIDPVAHIFVDPCNPKYSKPEPREIEKFIEYTDK